MKFNRKMKLFVVLLAVTAVFGGYAMRDINGNIIKDPFIHNYGTNNAFVGRGAGNFTLVPENVNLMEARAQFIKAVEQGDKNLAATLISQGVDIHSTPIGRIALEKAIKNNDKEMINMLKNRGVRDVREELVIDSFTKNL